LVALVELLSAAHQAQVADLIARCERLVTRLNQVSYN
jgi:hypothetical protein